MLCTGVYIPIMKTNIVIILIMNDYKHKPAENEFNKEIKKICWNYL